MKLTIAAILLILISVFGTIALAQTDTPTPDPTAETTLEVTPSDSDDTNIVVNEPNVTIDVPSSDGSVNVITDSPSTLEPLVIIAGAVATLMAGLYPVIERLTKNYPLLGDSTDEVLGFIFSTAVAYILLSGSTARLPGVDNFSPFVSTFITALALGGAGFGLKQGYSIATATKRNVQ